MLVYRQDECRSIVGLGRLSVYCIVSNTYNHFFVIPSFRKIREGDMHPC